MGAKDETIRLLEKEIELLELENAKLFRLLTTSRQIADIRLERIDQLQSTLKDLLAKNQS